MATFLINVEVNNRGATQGIAGVDRQLGTLDRSANRIAAAFAGLFAIQQVGRFVGSIGGVVEGFNRIERSAQIAAGPTGSVSDALNSVITTSRVAGAELGTTSQIFQRFALATRATGLEQAEVARITDTLVRGFQVFTGSAAEANSSITQLSQAFSSGRLAGDEFRSVSENFPPLLQAISDVTGVAVGDLRDFAAQGEITTDVLIAAFGRLEGQIADLEAAIDQNLSQIVNRLANEFQLLVGAIDNATDASGIFRDIISGLTGSLAGLRFDLFGGDVAETATALGEAEFQVELLTNRLQENGTAISILNGDYTRLLNAQRDVERRTFAYNELLDDQTEAAQDAADAAQLLEASQSALVGTVSQFNTVQQLQAQEVFGSTQAFFDQREELVRLEAQYSVTEAQADRLSGAFNTFIDAQVTGARETARLTAEAIELSAAYERIVPGVEAVSSGTAEYNAILTSSEIAVRNNVQVNAELEASIGRLTTSFAAFAGVGVQGLTNALANLNILGVDLQGTFADLAASIAQSLGVAESSVVNAASGVFSVLDGLGIGIEDIFGNRIGQAIQVLGSVSEEEFQGILDVGGAIFGGVGDVIEGVFGTGGTGQQALSSFGESSLSTLTSATANVDELQAATGGLNTSLASGALAAAGFGAAIGGVAANLAGANEQIQQTVSLGAGAGAALGFALGGPFGALVGGVAGGAAGAGLGDILFGDAEEEAEEARLRQVGIDLGTAIRNGFETTIAGLAAQLTSAELDAVVNNVEITVGNLNEALESSSRQLEIAVARSGGAASQLGNAANIFIDSLNISVETLNALSNASDLAAAQISEDFGIALIDVLQVFNQLPPGVADTFQQLQDNARQVAEVLSLQFGIPVEQIIALFDDLQLRVNESFGRITDATDALAVQLADRFGIAVNDVQAVLATLPEGTIGSFNDLAANADAIARGIAVSFGLSFEEARQVVLEFAERAGVTLSGIGVDAADLGRQLINEFELAEEGIAFLLLSVAQVGSEAFENIRTNADGSLSLLDARADATFNNLATVAGASSEDVQTLLRLLASNADISLGDILTSGIFAFEGLSEANIRSSTAILERFGVTSEQIAILFDGISRNGVDSFQELETQGAVIVARMAEFFGVAGEDIIGILDAVAANGDVAFSDLSASSRAELAIILNEFGITGDRVRFIFEDLAQGASSNFASIADSATVDANNVQTVFGSALLFILGAFGDLSGGAIANLLAIQGTGASVSSSLQASLGGAAAAARNTFGSIQSGANAARSAIRGALAAAAQITNPQQFADGGLITGPVGLGGAGAGRAFQTGGVLGGLTSIFGGGVTPASQLGLAGEAGPEAILPLDRIGGRLGVVASLPDSLIRVIQGGAGGGTTVIRENRVFIIRDASREDVDRLEGQILDVDASVESRAEGVFSEILAEVTGG